MPLSTSELDYHIAQIDANAPGAVSAYYEYLSQNGIEYGELAKNVANNEGALGKASNDYLEYVGRKANPNWTDEDYNNTRNSLVKDLAKADANSRKADIGSGGTGEISYDDISRYHYQVYGDNGLPKNAWAGSFWEEHVKSGSYMEGFDPDMDITPGDIRNAADSLAFDKTFNDINAREYFTDWYKSGAQWELALDPSGEGQLYLYSRIGEIIFELYSYPYQQVFDFLKDLFEAGYAYGGDVADAINDAAGAFADIPISPLVFDLDGDGLELSSLATSPAHFDLDNDGFAEKTGWVDADDGFLVRDLNSNGTIDNQNEMFGEDASGSAWDKLAAYDTNSDTTISGAERDALRIWRDLNQNGKTDSGELFTLQDAGIASINLYEFGANATIEGHEVDGGGQWTMTSGGTIRNYYDVFFQLDQVNSWFVGDGVTTPTIDAETLFLPLSRGYGAIKSLHLAASEDSGLKTKLENLMSTTSYSTLNDKIFDVLYEWAGVDGVLPSTGGDYVDGRTLEFLEHLGDSEYIKFGWSGDVTEPQFPEPASWVIDAFIPAFAELKSRLLVQSSFASVFINSYYDFTQDKLVFGEALDLYLSRAAGLAPESEAENPWYWSEIANIVVQNSAAFGLSESAAKAQVDAYAGYTVEIWDNYLKGTSGADKWVGSNSRDYITAGDGNDTIRSYDGDDYVNLGSGLNDAFSGDGDDTIYGGADVDWLYGEKGNDLIYGGGGNDFVIGDRYPDEVGNDTLHGGDGNDYVKSSYGENMLFGEAGNDTLIGSDGSNTLVGGAGADQLELGNGGFDLIKFMAISDSTVTISGTNIVRTNADILRYFDDGIDKIDLLALGFSALTTNSTTLANEVRKVNSGPGSGYTHVVNDQTGFGFYFHTNIYNQIDASDFIFANPSATVTGTANADSLTGGAAINDVMSGLAGVDTLKGGSGDDTLNGGAGADYLYGEAGADTFKISAISDSAATGNAFDRILDFENGIDTIDLSALDFYGITSASVTTPGLLRYYLNSGGTITYLKSDQVDFMISINGNHMSNLDAGDFIFGGQAPNFIYGTASAESVIGGTASEALYGRAGNDTLKGGNGHDTLDGGAGADRLYGEIGQDVFKFSDVSHSVTVTGGYDIIYGFEDGIDRIDLTGLGFTSLVTGTPGTGELKVSLNSLGTATYIKSDTATSFLISIDGNHLAEIDASDFIFGPVSTFNGTAGNDSLTGGTGGDGLFAFAGDDTLQGGDGADTLIGGVGFDRLYGGAGVDHFKFTNVSHSLDVTGQYDRIYDFTNDVDKIDLSGLGFTSLVTGTPGAGQLRVSLSSDLSWTYVKSDTATNFIIAIQGNHLADLDADDFIFG